MCPDNIRAIHLHQWHLVFAVIVNYKLVSLIWRPTMNGVDMVVVCGDDLDSIHWDCCTCNSVAMH